MVSWNLLNHECPQYKEAGMVVEAVTRNLSPSLTLNKPCVMLLAILISVCGFIF
jgi:hypothetical protein